MVNPDTSRNALFQDPGRGVKRDPVRMGPPGSKPAEIKKTDEERPTTPSSPLDELRQRLFPTGQEIADNATRKMLEQARRRQRNIFPGLDQNNPQVPSSRIKLGRKKPF